MMNNSFFILFFSVLITLFLITKIEFRDEYLPSPAEYIEQKKDRKIYKKHRKEYFEMMHKSSSHTDWAKMNQDYRNSRFIKSTEYRNRLEQSILNDYSETFFNRDLQGVWEERGSNNLAGRVHTIEVDFDEGIIYCGSSGGNIWIGSLSGTGWVSANDYMQINNINMIRLVSSSDINNRLLISGGNKFYYSDNQGFTINQSSGLENVASWGEIYRSVVSYFDNQVTPTIFVLTKEWSNGSVARIFRSDDLGENFYQIYSTSLLSERAYDIWIDRYSPSDLFFLKNGELYSISILNNSMSYIGSAGPLNQGENILTAGKDSQNNGSFHFYTKIGDRLYFSNNGGTIWTDKGELPSYTFFRNSFSGSYDNQNILAIGGIDLFRSLNSGNNWERVNNWWEYYENPSIYLHADIPEIKFIKNNQGNEITFISTDGGLYISDNMINEVENLSLNGLGVSQYYSTYTKREPPYQIFAGSQDQGFQRSIDYASSIYDFEQVISGDYGHIVSSDNGNSLWTVYPGFAMYYPNASINSSGITWDFQMDGHLWMPPLMEDPYDPFSVYLAGGGLSGGNHILKLTRSGNSITANQGLYSFNSTVTAIAYSPIDPLHRYALTYNGKFYYSSDGGINWLMSSGFTGPESHYFYGSKILPSKTELGRVIIAGSGYSNPPVFITYNHGDSFENMSQGMPNTLVYDLASTNEESFIFAATAVGAFAFSMEDGSWEDILGVEGPDQTYWTVEFISDINTVRFGTYGRGIWDFIIDENIDIVLGDLNEDSIINIQDIIILIGISLSELNPSDYQIIAGDINEDLTIDILDIITCINIILND